ncbi:MAG: hypothetical protein QXF72_02495 [Nitrososphaerota archaeon]
MLLTVLWGLRHRRLAIRIYTLLCSMWLLLLATFYFSFIIANVTLESAIGGIILVFMLGFPPLIPIIYLRRREEKKVKEVRIDPYLSSAKEKALAMERYFKGETSVSWSPIITLAHDALISILQRMLIDLKGSEAISIIEQLRREKKLYLHTLSKMLKDNNVIDEEDMKNLEILRDLRNRIVHEDYHPSKEQALWVVNFTKTFITKHYPELKL